MLLATLPQQDAVSELRGVGSGGLGNAHRPRIGAGVGRFH
jgi:hypothetical protein